MNTFDFSDKVALVTGGSRGIGRATALLFAQTGAKVVIGDVDPAGEETVETIKRDRGETVFAKTDVREAERVEQLVATTVADPRDVPAEPRVERHKGAEEFRRIDGHLFRPVWAGGEGIQLGADRSEAAVRIALPPVRPEEGAVREDVEAVRRRGSEVRKQKHEN